MTTHINEYTDQPVPSLHRGEFTVSPDFPYKPTDTFYYKDEKYQVIQEPPHSGILPDNEDYFRKLPRNGIDPNAPYLGTVKQVGELAHITTSGLTCREEIALRIFTCGASITIKGSFATADEFIKESGK